MDTERALLSCPGRIQDWLGVAADQIETLLQVPMPSLSGSDQAIGALRIKRERPSRTTGPYSLRSTHVASDEPPTSHQVSASVSSGHLLYAEKSQSRCENCVAEKRSRCSRDLPSCTRCRDSGMLCFYAVGTPTGRRKPQGRRRERRRIRERGPDNPSAESLLVALVPERPALWEVGGAVVALHSELDTVARSESTPARESPVETTLFQDPDLGEKRGTFEDGLQKRVDDEIQQGVAHLPALPLQAPSPSPRYPSSVSSLATTPFASTLGSRSTSQTSGTDSLPITPAAESPSAPLDGTDTQPVVGREVSVSQVSASHITPLASREVSAPGDAEARLSHMEKFVEHYLLSHHARRIAHDTVSSTDPQRGTFSDGFLEELFEEGEAARKLVELQRCVPEGGEFPSMS